MARTVALALVASSLLSCGDDEVDLTVDVITNYVPGVDFAVVVTEVSATALALGSPASVQRAETTVNGDEDFLRGARVAEIADVGAGRRYVRVTLRDASDARLAVRTVELNLAGSFAATVLFTSACESVVCDPPEECQAGECVDARCSPSTPEFCETPPACDGDDECETMIGASCDGTAICSAGVCFCRATPAFEAICDNGLDDDGDGLTDCADLDCHGAVCDDGDACTHADRCADLSCAGTSVTCDDTECVTRECNGTAACTETPHTGRPCADDGIPCTIDQCDDEGFCDHVYLGENARCHPSASHYRCCGGSCVDTHTNRIHCGGCGLTCGFAGLNECYYSAKLDAAYCVCPMDDPGWCVGVDTGVADCAFNLCYCLSDAGCPATARCVDDDPLGGLPYCRYP